MDVEVLLHGVPSGQDYYGLKGEQKQAAVFYVKSQESVKLVVEVKKTDNIPYVYYTYLRYKGVIGATGRAGSYIGITLRLDVYYTDVSHIYNMLDIAFKKYVVGTLLTTNNDSYKYIAPDFSSKKTDVERLQQGIVQLIQATCIASKFITIDNSFLNPVTNSPECNIADASEHLILTTIKKCSKVSISPDYKSSLERDYEKKLQEIEGRGSNVIAEKEKTIAQKDTTIASLNTTIATRESRIASLERELKTRDKELLDQKKSGDINQKIDKVKEPILALAEYFHVKENNVKPSTKFGQKNFYVGLINSGLLVVAIVVLSFVFLKVQPPKEVEEPNVSMSKYKTLQTKYTELESRYSSLEKKHLEIWSLLDEKTRKEVEKKLEKKNLTVSNTTDVSQSSSSINLEIKIDPKVETVEVGKTYTFSVSGYNGKGEWKVDGFKIAGDKTKSSVKAEVIEKEGQTEAVISYTPESGKKMSRKFKYKQL